MTNIFARFFITLLLSFLFITSNSLAFHKKDSKSDNKISDWDGTPGAKKISETIAKKDFCAHSAKGIKVIETGDPVIDQTTGKQRNINLVSDYNISNVSLKIERIILSHIDFVNRVVWQKGS